MIAAGTHYLRTLTARALAMAAIILLAFSSPGVQAQNDNKEVLPKATTETTATVSEQKASGENTADEKATKASELTIASWGGAYGESQRRAYAAPFEKKTGISIKIVSHNGKLDDLKGEEGARGWDIVDLGPEMLDRACRDGKLEKLDVNVLAASDDGEDAKEDFIPGTLHECGIPSVAWSSAIVFDKRAFKKTIPSTASDFFDIKKFPGKRALPKGPRYALELALLADGVAANDVYKELETASGLSRALRQMDKIRDHIVWWDRAHEPLKLLSKQEAVMGLAFNGRIFSAIVAENKPFGIIWDGQVYDLDYWSIPKETAHLKSALEFIAFATRPEQLARQAEWFPYGPVRKSALDKVGKHPEIDVKMSAYIPTSKENFKRALRRDTSWWREHEAEINARFKAWSLGDGGSALTGEDAERENAS